MSWQSDYLDRFYRQRPGWTDGTVDFHELCRRHIPTGSRILELGPGSGGQTSEFLASIAASTVGLDVDPAAKENPFLDEVHIYDGQDFPFDDASFGAVVADYSLEHVEAPSEMLREISRVLAGGGAFVFRTPNARHYVSVLSHILPDSVSRWARARDSDHPVFPKHFRFNTPSICRRRLRDVDMEVVELKMVEKEPSYGMGSRFLFVLMMGYERLVNSTPALSGLRANILCTARRGTP